MNYIPTQSDLHEMSIHSFGEHAKELLGKWEQLTQEQRRELREIGRMVLTAQQKEVA